MSFVHTHVKRRGLGLAELMISLAITASLLTAVAAAFSSSATVIENNDRFFRATQSARVALNQMLTEVRRADAIVDRDTTFTVGAKTFVVKGITANILPVYRPAETRQAGEMVRYYRYDTAGKRLMLSFVSDAGVVSAEYPLAENVESSPFTWDLGQDANNADCVSRVAIAMDVKVDSSHVRVSGSAAPRRSITYK